MFIYEAAFFNFACSWKRKRLCARAMEGKRGDDAPKANEKRGKKVKSTFLPFKIQPPTKKRKGLGAPIISVGESGDCNEPFATEEGTWEWQEDKQQDLLGRIKLMKLAQWLDENTSNQEQACLERHLKKDKKKEKKSETGKRKSKGKVKAKAAKKAKKKATKIKMQKKKNESKRKNKALAKVKEAVNSPPPLLVLILPLGIRRNKQC